ncbi:MAG: DNA topoisomerase I [Planctomycetaceae bacterium]
MGSLFRALMHVPLLRSVLRPFTRVLIGAIAIPIFRFILRNVFRLQELDDELEKDLEQWFRGSLLLLAATANMEHLLFGWANQWDWFTIGLRLLLAIGVVEAMPDQELFAVIHPGPPRLKPGKTILVQAWRKKFDIARGLVCQHLNRSSPVLAIMAAIFGAQISASHFAAEEAKLAVKIEQRLTVSMPVKKAKAQAAKQARAQRELEEEQAWEQFTVGWVCYLLAITQYLIIGLVTSRDRAMDVLSEFDRAVAKRRRELVEEFDLNEEEAALVEGKEAPSKEVTESLPKDATPELETTEGESESN